MRESGRCDHDWQGPSDEECLDDLLVIPCEFGWGHVGEMHYGHHPDDGDSVMWTSSAGDLLRPDGTVRQAQLS